MGLVMRGKGRMSWVVRERMLAATMRKIEG
jgi:hypothetical protein